MSGKIFNILGAYLNFSAEGAGTNPSDNFKLRAISAVVLVGIALCVLWIGSWLFAAFVALLGILISWEWMRLVRKVDRDIAFIVHAAAVSFAALATLLGQPFVAFLVVVAASVVVGVLSFSNHPIFSCLGVYYAGLPAIALVWLRGDDIYGFLAVLFIFLIVWVSDTFAYLVGSSVGGPKLWPSVSPNKTWSGLIGALLGSALIAFLFSLITNTGIIGTMVLTGVILGIFSQLGDLAESALKRAFKVKDVSGLIPGHGGVMDRLDSLIAVAVCAGLVGVIANVDQPARALFFGAQ